MSILEITSKITCKGVNLNGKKCSNNGNFLNQNGYCAKHITQDTKAHLIHKKSIVPIQNIEKLNKIQHHCQASKIKSKSSYDNCSSPVGVKLMNHYIIDNDGNEIETFYLCNKHSSKFNKDTADNSNKDISFKIYPYNKCKNIFHNHIQNIIDPDD
jgi:hypothetical protein